MDGSVTNHFRMFRSRAEESGEELFDVGRRSVRYQGDHERGAKLSTVCARLLSETLPNNAVVVDDATTTRIYISGIYLRLVDGHGFNVGNRRSQLQPEI